MTHIVFPIINLTIESYPKVVLGFQILYQISSRNKIVSWFNLYGWLKRVLSMNVFYDAAKRFTKHLTTSSSISRAQRDSGDWSVSKVTPVFRGLPERRDPRASVGTSVSWEPRAPPDPRDLLALQGPRAWWACLETPDRKDDRDRRARQAITVSEDHPAVTGSM